VVFGSVRSSHAVIDAHPGQFPAVPERQTAFHDGVNTTFSPPEMLAFCPSDGLLKSFVCSLPAFRGLCQRGRELGDQEFSHSFLEFAWGPSAVGSPLGTSCPGWRRLLSRQGRDQLRADEPHSENAENQQEQAPPKANKERTRGHTPSGTQPNPRFAVHAALLSMDGLRLVCPCHDRLRSFWRHYVVSRCWCKEPVRDVLRTRSRLSAICGTQSHLMAAPDTG